MKMMRAQNIFLMFAAAVFFLTSALAQVAPAPRRQMLTWGAPAVLDPTAIDPPVNTLMLTIPLPAEIYAVRVVLAQGPKVENAWVVQRMLFALSTSFNDERDPTGTAPGQPPSWVPVTWAHGGASFDEPVTPLTALGSYQAQAREIALADGTAVPQGSCVVGSGIPVGTQIVGEANGNLSLSASTVGGGDAARLYFMPCGAESFTVPPYAGRPDPGTGSKQAPQMYYSDWVPVQDQPRGARVLMIRTLVPAQNMTRGARIGCGVMQGAPAFDHGLDQWGTWRANEDHVTIPDTRDYTAFCGEGQQIIYAVQFLSASAGIQVQSIGDSHFAGAGTKSGMDWVFQSVLDATSPTLPFEQQDSATGLSSAAFIPRGLADFAADHPSILVLEGWTANDHPLDGTAPYDYLARVLMMAQRCRLAGCVPIVVTPFPRNPEVIKGATLQVWTDIRARILALRGIAVFDATPLLGAQSGGAFTGTYLPGFSDDHVHPNDTAIAALRAPFARLLRQIAGLH